MELGSISLELDDDSYDSPSPEPDTDVDLANVKVTYIDSIELLHQITFNPLIHGRFSDPYFKVL